jgi:hypothetical protein
MIAYNSHWLSNLLVREQADTANRQNCISATEKEQIYGAYPADFYTPNLFVRIGLFILTMVILVFGMGLVSLIFLSSNSDRIYGFLFILFGIAIYFGLEFMVRKGHYRSGVDDALLWMCGICVVGGLNVLTPVSPAANAFFVFCMAVFLFFRFVNAVMAAVASLALLATVFYIFMHVGGIMQLLMPFVLMIIAALLYFGAKSRLHQPAWVHYRNGLLFICITALVCFYAAGNYFVVREASVNLLYMEIKQGQDIGLAWLFWVFTIGIPLLYIARGVQIKDAVLLRVGLLLIAAMVFTIRSYHQVLPAEIAMVLGGILFIGIAYGLIKYLHEPKHGFTYREADDPFFLDKLQVESLVIADTFSGPAVAPDTGTQFGGGSGGGGGASGEF